MILIFSNNFEASTYNVAKWLLFYEEKFVIITETNTIKNVFCSISEKDVDIQLTTKTNQLINFNDITSIWYRRGMFNYNIPKEEVGEYFIHHEKQEWKSINEFLMLQCTKNSINDYFMSDLNKNEILIKAINAGLKVPKTVIACNKNDVVSFFRKEKIICKTISNILHKDIDGVVYTMRTIEVEKEELPEYFSPSLFQELILKKYELRIFYFKRNFYAAAIFSQSDDNTIIDFRNYNYSKPNRIVPYNLNEELKIKIISLMEDVGLNSGSIDMIVTPDNNHYFLEINAVGQFGMVSKPCNYFCEKHLAKELLSANV